MDHIQPELIEGFVQAGGTLWACTPCFNARGLGDDKLVDGTVVTGAGPMLDWVAAGASVISY